ncbi:MAG: DinB family protein [Candidatus Dormibacteria bacterium]
MPKRAVLSEITSLLERTPRAIRELLSGLPESWLTGTDTPGGWTPRDVVGHLISAELTDWIPRAEMIMSRGTGTPFEPFDRLAHVERDRGLPLDSLIPRFEQLRIDNLRRLMELVQDDTDLERRGLHPEFGEVTMGQLLSTWAVHDLDHLGQVNAALAASRATAVGPWKAYLGILAGGRD